MAGLVLVNSISQARVYELQESLPAKLAKPRWMYTESEKAPAKGVEATLWRIQDANQKGKWKSCLKNIAQARPKAKGLGRWLTYMEMRCLHKQGLGVSERRSRMRAIFASIEKEPELLQFFRTSSLAKPQFWDSNFALLEAEAKANRSRAWERVGKILNLRDELTDRQLAKLYRTSGDLAFIEQNLKAAWDFYRRSLKYKAEPELEKKVALIEKSINLSPSETAVNVASKPGGDENLLYTKKELRLVDQMKAALNSKDFVSAVEDGVSLLEDYPGSEWSDWASDQVLKIYLGVVNKSDRRYATIRRKILRSMKSADSDRLFRWARNAWARGAYEDAVGLCDQAIDKIKPHPDERKMLLLAGNSSVSAGDYSSAKSYYEKLTRRFAGTVQAIEGRFRLGLLYFRLKDYSRAASQFEKLIAIPDLEKYHLESLYWAWRSYQKGGRKGAESYATRLIKEYPLTYYGIRARAESNEGVLTWEGLTASTKQSQRVSVSLTDSQNRAHERFQQLLKAGWLKEAREELKALPVAVNAVQKVLYANYWASTLDHYQSIKILNQAWDQDDSLRNRTFIKQAFPKEFSEYVEKRAAEFSLAPEIVYALIRQESSFRPDVKSPANAAGLMQIVPITAKDIARYLRYKKPLRIPQDLFEPSLNVRFGASYLKRMVRAFDGHLPLALAAYNAGIGRMRRWLNSRSDIGVDERNLTSTVESEIWIDEMPWSETRYYVKSILRNYLIYQWLAQDKLELPAPVWKL
ncbi:MAG: transglycosylase SLT domain-containing protein [Bdellovibrionales bacterium]|nr:transglycosylase SLT domain-containing protein [Bdellovibrionales bacterium]